LIGGRARRLGGRVKHQLPVGGQPILTRQLEALNRARVEHIALVGRWSIEERPPVPVFADAMEDAGSLGALYTALIVAPGDCTIVLAGDLPFIGPQLLDRLGQLGREDEAVIPRTADGLQPLCGGYRRSVALRLKAQIDRGALGIRNALADIRVRELDAEQLSVIDPDGTMLMNVNTLADYERACRAARGHA
jgi:molybdopterin-guanine dinucleotide biosynthesis protein A